MYYMIYVSGVPDLELQPFIHFGRTIFAGPSENFLKNKIF
jgi:hypothetical protein